MLGAVYKQNNPIEFRNSLFGKRVILKQKSKDGRSLGCSGGIS